MTFSDEYHRLIDNHQKEQDSMTDAYLVQAGEAQPEEKSFQLEMESKTGTTFILNVPATDLINEDGSATVALLELRGFMGQINHLQNEVREGKEIRPRVSVDEMEWMGDLLRIMKENKELFRPMTEYVLSMMAEKCYDQAASKGFHDDDRGVIEEIALIHSEASEWLEEVRDGHGPEEHYYSNPEDKTETRKTFQIFPDVGKLWKPEGQAAEAADIIIRVMDACGNPNRRIDIARAVFEKFQYNKTRGHKHGKTC
ncbi:nucleoside triphosphate pyrophosphohydrolase [Rhodococcus phage ChewyVIII]|uniref:Nucleoside triphosphate pyrophosphohydrolase n=1 Tax=Rhodococcus phage ChewyVIII TaxID=1887657 RepID=A0A1C9EI42_9CAUD|nr:nucleoside triphosphate pyrophosphohydrolase [Rhodococcus phage ChewyVIII]AON97454.1 nucleoside triphosphate pyrophosphohydrolase [Rhodococcus phage ChewyVIII]